MNDKLNPNDILIAEYNFAAQTAFQANEDRIKVFNYFLANIGTLIAAVALPAVTDIVSHAFFGGVFLMLFIIGILTLLQLVKVRQAWYESVRAMNQIKEYYISTFNDKALSSAFRWRATNIPKPGKAFTIAYLLGLITMILNSVSLGAAILLLSNGNKIDLIPMSILVGIIALAAQNVIWFIILKRS